MSIGLFEEITLTPDNDTTVGEDLQLIFGLQGDDVFNLEPGTLPDGDEATIFAGGSGSDTYNAALNNTIVVAESGNSDGDVLNVPDISLLDTDNFIAFEIDDRHLYAGDISSDQYILLLDWREPANQIELFNIGGTNLTFDFLESNLDLLPDFDGNVPIEDVSPEDLDLARVGLTAAEFDDAVNEVFAQAAALESSEPPVNAAPIFTSQDAITLAPGNASVLELTADDADGDALSFAISGGADAGEFAIAESTLVFATAPTLESLSADGDNVFEVEVSASDGTNDPVLQAVTVTVSDEAPPEVDLNIDAIGADLDPFVDVLNIFRVAAGAPQAVVVTAAAAEAGITQQTIVDAADAIAEGILNVDSVSGFDPFVDALNIFRVLAGAPQAVVVTAAAAEIGITQQIIVDNVQALAA